MASCGSAADVVIWTTDWKSNNCIKTYLDEEHENQIDSVAFANDEAAKSLTIFLNN